MIGYETESVYAHQMKSGYWELIDSETEMQVSIHDCGQDALKSAIKNGYIIS